MQTGLMSQGTFLFQTQKRAGLGDWAGPSCSSYPVSPRTLLTARSLEKRQDTVCPRKPCHPPGPPASVSNQHQDGQTHLQLGALTFAFGNATERVEEGRRGEKRFLLRCFSTH